MTYQKSDVQFHSDGSGRAPHAAVNVKVGRPYHYEVHTTFDPAFTRAWVEEHVDERKARAYFDMACQDGWDALEAEATSIFGPGYGVFSEGRSAGWAVVHYEKREQFSPEIVEGWDAIALARWAKFAKRAREIADDVPYQILVNTYANEFVPWQEEQLANAK